MNLPSDLLMIEQRLAARTRPQAPGRLRQRVLNITAEDHHDRPAPSAWYDVALMAAVLLLALNAVVALTWNRPLMSHHEPITPDIIARYQMIHQALEQGDVTSLQQLHLGAPGIAELYSAQK